MDIYTIYALAVISFGLFGHWIGKQKRRPPGEGLILGAFFGPVGCIIEALLPNGDIRPKRTTADRFATRLDLSELGIEEEPKPDIIEEISRGLRRD